MQDRYRIKDGQCLDCAGDVAGWLQKLPGVRKVHVIFPTRNLVVEHDGRATEGAVREQCARLGLELARVTTTRREHPRGVWWHQPKLIALLVVVFSLGEVLEEFVSDRARNSDLPPRVLPKFKLGIHLNYPSELAGAYPIFASTP